MEIYRDDRFDPAFTKELTLLLHADSHAMQYAVIHAEAQDVMLLADRQLPPSGNNGTAPLLQLMNQTDELHAAYKAIHLSISAAPFLLQPSSTKSEEATSHPLLQTGTDTQWQLDTVKDDVQVAFSISQARLPLQDIPVTITHTHHVISGLLATIESQGWSGDHITVLVTHRQMLVVGHQNSHLAFANAFHFSSKDDFIYYLMLVAEQLHMDQETCTVHLCGALAPEAQITREIHKFFRNYTFESFGLSRMFRLTPSDESLSIAMPVLALLPCV